jgi:hypothetical protein
LTEATSDSSTINCVLGEVPTSYSHSSWAVGEVQQELDSGVYFGVSDVSKAFDKNVFTRVDQTQRGESTMLQMHMHITI